MNVQLLREHDEAEWARCYDEMWSIAMQGASGKLCIPPFNEQDRKDVASNVIGEMAISFIYRCVVDEDGDSVRRMIRYHTRLRSVDYWRRNHARLERQFIRSPIVDDADEREANLAMEDIPPVTLEFLVQELFAQSRNAPLHGLTARHELVFREVDINGLTHEEFARVYGIPAGTVGRLSAEATRWLRRYLRQH